MVRDEQGVVSCTCSEGPACRRAGKHPAVNYGDLPAGTEDYRGPNQGHAIATGIRSGIFVIDTDGLEAETTFVTRAEGEEDDGLDTYTVATPSGGKHRYYAWPGFPVRNSVGEYMPHVDVRGDGGFVVMAGSPHKSGREYVVERNIAPRAAPPWLLTWPGLKGRSVELGAGGPTPIDIATPEGQRRIRMGREACETYPACADGSGGTPLMNLSLRLIRDLELPVDVAHELVATHYNQRCTNDAGDPYPWNDEEIDHKLTDARDKSDRPCGIFSEGFVDALAAACTEATPAPLVARRMPSASHVYECSIGDVPNGQPRKCSQGEVLAELFGNPSWAGVLQHDVFRDKVFAVNPPIPLLGAEKGQFCDEDLTAIRHWFECKGQLSVSKEAAWDCANAVAKRNAFHPLREYLEALPPTTGAIADLCMALGLKDPFEETYVRLFLIAAVRRALHPGCKVDNMLVLHGAPGLKKSTFLLALFGQEWASENLTNIEDAKAVGEVLNGKWVAEVAELKDIMRAGNETVAAFITRRTERFRAAYARGNAIDYPRSCVLVGSTNEHEILRNATGADARRFWIIAPATAKIDIAWIEANRDAVWGEALQLARDGVQHWLTDEEEAVHMARSVQYQLLDGWHDAVTVYCTGRETVRVEDMWKSMGGTADKLDGRIVTRITDTLKRLGCTRDVVGKKRVRVWRVPVDVRDGEVPAEEQIKRASADAVAKIMTN